MTIGSRQQRAIAYLLLALFSLGYLGVSGRTCATEHCGPLLGFLVASGAVTTILALTIAIALIIWTQERSEFLALFECPLSCFLLIWCSIALGLTMLLMEGLYSPISAPTLTAFAWLSESLALLLAAAALLGADGPLRAFRAERHTGGARQGAVVAEDGARPADRERDAVSEERYMDGAATGDPNYDTTNMVGTTLPLAAV